MKQDQPRKPDLSLYSTLTHNDRSIIHLAYFMRFWFEQQLIRHEELI